MNPPDPPSKPLWTRRGLLRRGLLGAVGLCAGGIADARVEPGWVEVSRIDLTLPHLPDAFHGTTLAQISDLHMDGWMTPDRLRGVVDRVNGLEPDYVAITGDFVTYKPRKFADGLIHTLSRLTPKETTVAVLGNHDHWTSAEVVRHVLRESGVRELNNDVLTLKKGKSRLLIAGVDDIWSGQPDLDAVVKRVPDGAACILLAHEPDFADTSAATGKFGLQLSGHSHGGQVRMPFYGPIHVPRYAKNYPAGLYEIDGMRLYTNRGIGMVGPHVRLNCRPEITLFTLQAIGNK